jgi:5-methylcytosine-specific restriction endonuclease McrA
MLVIENKIQFERCAYYLNDFSKCEMYLPEREKPTRNISKSVRYEVLDQQHWRCNICGKHLKYSENHSYGDVVAHIDHIHPFSQWKTYNGDINELSNLQALCPDCNMKKHSKDGF